MFWRDELRVIGCIESIASQASEALARLTSNGVKSSIGLAVEQKAFHSTLSI